VDLRKLLPADIDEAAMERMLATAGVVKDGKLDLAEFKQMMQGASL
jgi:Ca2+-binding EF-hand superfamily protein